MDNRHHAKMLSGVLERISVYSAVPHTGGHISDSMLETMYSAVHRACCRPESPYYRNLVMQVRSVAEMLDTMVSFSLFCDKEFFEILRMAMDVSNAYLVAKEV